MMPNLPEVVLAALAADVPVLLWGAPGTGKTAAIMAAAKEVGAVVEVLIGSVTDPIDVGGYLLPSGGTITIVPPPWARRLRTALDGGREAWLVLDELSCAPPSVQAALLRVVHERQVAGVDLVGCRVIGAANPTATAADGGWLPPATANRWAHVEWQVSPTTWVAHTIVGWGVPRSSSWTVAAARIATWIARSPAALLSVPATEMSGRAWPSPRSWTAAIGLLSCLPPGANSVGAVVACVGEGAAAEWGVYDAARDLPDPEEVLAGRATLPNRGDQRAAALLSIVAAAAGEHAERERRLDVATSIIAAERPDRALTPARALLSAYGGDVPPALRAFGEIVQAGRLSLQ